MAYYDRIAKTWHRATGSTGGPLKRALLNDAMLEAVGRIDGEAILELGAGNGYFARLLRERRSGQVPARHVVTDIAGDLLELGRRSFGLDVELQQLDVRGGLPFEDAAFDIGIASMLLPELTRGQVRNLAAELGRVIACGGRVALSTLHADYIAHLERAGRLRRSRGRWLMRGPSGVELSARPHRRERLRAHFESAGFEVSIDELVASPELTRTSRGMRDYGERPVALVLIGRHSASDDVT